MSGLASLFTSGFMEGTPNVPMEGRRGPGAEYPPTGGIDIAYAGVLYGLTPVVISATLGNIGAPLPGPMGMEPNGLTSSGLGGGASLGALSLLAAIERVETPPEMRGFMAVEPLWELVGLL